MAPSNHVIETQRLVLRKPRKGDARALHAGFADPEVMRYIGLGETFADLEQTRAWLDKALARWKADGFGSYMIELKDSGKVIGRSGFLVWDPDEWRTGTLKELGDDAAIELGWLLAREHWGNGYATEAAREVLRFGFDELALDEIVSFTSVPNTPSRRVMEKIGMTHEPARDFDHPHVPDGPLKRHVLYAIRR
jgi:RimJ/RimL family protein N-acetyltransferase